MIDKIFHSFEGKNHKEVMLRYIYITIMAILILSISINILRQYYVTLDITIIMFILFAIGFYFYQKSTSDRRVDVYVTFLILISELVLAGIILKEEFLHYTTVFPLLITFAIFYFYSLKMALFATGLHLLYWMGIHTYGYIHYPQHPILHNITAIMGLVISYTFMTMFGFSYYVSTYIYQKQLEKANLQKEVLLKEIHHRVKNNLNIIASILGLEKFESNSAEVHKLISQNKLRIESIAMVHEILYQSTEFENISFKSYLTKLSTHILHTESNEGDIALSLDIVPLNLDIESMMQFGIIINELITNSIKYAFPNKKGKIDITLQKHEHHYKLVYEDDGVGLKNNKSGFGQNLIKISVQQLEGTLKMTNKNGLKYEIVFQKDIS